MLFDSVYSIIIYPILFILPAYVANGAPVLSRGRWRGKWLLDRGKMIKGRRILGNNKTLPGTLISLAAGIIVSLIEYPFLPYMLPVGILLTVGANVGDLAGSFVKRMARIAPGKNVPVLDQYDFLAGAFLFALPFLSSFPSLYGIVFIVVLTGVMHVLTNLGAYRLRLKDVPW